MFLEELVFFSRKMWPLLCFTLFMNVCYYLSARHCVVTVCVSAAGLFCDPGADGAVLVLPEDSLQAGPLCSRAGVFVGGGGHGGGRHSGWKRPGIQ